MKHYHPPRWLCVLTICMLLGSLLGVAQLRAAPRAAIAGKAGITFWQELGPFHVGGRIRAIAVHPTNPDILYTAGVSGGVWKSTTGGGSWQPLTDLTLPNLAVVTMVLDPTDPNRIYVGTGESLTVILAFACFSRFLSSPRF